MAFDFLDPEAPTKDQPGTLTGSKPSADQNNAGPDSSRGELLDLAKEDPLKCVKRQVEYWESQDPAIRLLKPYWDANRFWYRGYRGIRLRPISRELYNSVELWVAPGAFDQPTVMNRIPELIERLTAHMFQDPAVPDSEPVADTPTNLEAAEFNDRLITNAGSEATRNDQLTFRTAFAKASLYASTFTYQYPDPHGGRKMPKIIEAHPDLPNGTPKDVAHLAPDGQPHQGPWAIRYETEDGAITQDASQAAQTFEPRICRETLTSPSVRPLPDTAKNIADADGVMIVSLTTVGQLKQGYKAQMDALSPQEWNDLITWRPEAAKWIVPAYIRKSKAWTGPMRDANGLPEDNAIVVQLGTYYRAKSGSYENGAYVLSAGKSVLLHADEWMAHYEGPNGEQITEALDLPVSQMRQLVDIDNETFYGLGLVSQIGPLSEVAGAIVLGWLDHMDRFLHPIQWVPLGSNVQLEDLAARDGSPQYFNHQGQPVTEEIPPFLPDGIQFFGMATEAMQSVVGIFDAAQGNADAGDSGRKVALEHGFSMVNLSQMRQNTADFIERDWRIFTQLTRAFTPITQRLQYVGEDGEYKEKAWRGSDLAGVGIIRIGMGSFTQRSQEVKQMLVDGYVQRGAMDQFEAMRVMKSSVRAEIALEDDPFWLKVNREVSAWEDGPGPDWAQQVQQFQQAMAAWQQQTAQLQAQQAQQAQQPPPVPGQPPAAAQGAQQQIPPQPSPPTGPFRPDPSDDIPSVALQRFHVLARELPTKAFEKQTDKMWRQTILDAFERARQASSQMTVAEQQQMQQAGMQQQVSAEIAIKRAGRSDPSAIDQAVAQSEAQSTAVKADAEKTKARLDVIGKAVDVTAKTGIPPGQVLAGVQG